MTISAILSNKGSEVAVVAVGTSVREVVALPTVLALGAGLLPAMMGDRRALHDRLSHTAILHRPRASAKTQDGQ